METRVRQAQLLTFVAAVAGAVTCRDADTQIFRTDIRTRPGPHCFNLKTTLFDIFTTEDCTRTHLLPISLTNFWRIYIKIFQSTKKKTYQNSFIKLLTQHFSHEHEILLMTSLWYITYFIFSTTGTTHGLQVRSSSILSILY